MIKLFEEYNNDYYHEISKEEYDLYMNSEVFTDEEINSLKKLIFGIKLISGSLIKFKKSFYIDKLPDEWYILNDYNHNNNPIYYKCDQFEGLLKCIKDKAKL